MTLQRRQWLLAGAATLAGCRPEAAAEVQGGWVGASPQRGHRLRESKAGSLPNPALQHHAGALVLGGGIAGLAAARALQRQGIDEVHLLELEDDAGGNSRGHAIAGLACPLGAHYLPLPGPQAHEVSEWLFELGLARQQAGRTVFDEQHLCHAPQERLFFDGAWHDGLLPPAEGDARLAAQYRGFARAVAQAQRELGFSVPSTRSPWTSGHAALDAMSFAEWLRGQGLDHPALRWYLDYCCRDDYGAGSAEVSAWAGLHYFASRHGFHAPGDEEAEREPVLTWPEGNAWLARRLAAPLQGRLHTGRTVLRVEEGRHEVQVLVWDEAAGRAEAWRAPRCVVALPLFVAARVLANPSAALGAALAVLDWAPWLVANLHIRAPLLQRQGAAPAWDNVTYGSTALGYVDAGHQRLDPTPGATVLTAYRALPRGERGALLSQPWAHWAGVVLDGLAPLHPDLRAKLLRADLARWGHAMAIPRPGVRGHAALAALRGARGRLRFAHADLVGHSVFEEAFTLGHAAGAGSLG